MVNKSNNDDIKLFFGSLAIGGIVSVIVFVIYWEANKDIASEVLSPFFGNLFIASFCVFSVLPLSLLTYIVVYLLKNESIKTSIRLLANKFSTRQLTKNSEIIYPCLQTSVYKGYKQDKIEMRGDRAEMSDFPLYQNTVAGGLDRRDQTIGGFSFVVKIYAVPVVEIIG